MMADTRASTAHELPAVLFVDDEEGVLAGLRSSLRRLRRTYRFHFADGAELALAILEREPIDLIVTDMRMPGVNGVELLKKVKAHHPQVIRYVLSGEAEQELVIQALPVAHRWLTKPCDRETMTEALAEAVRFRTLFSDPTIKAAVSGADALPTPPALHVEITELLADSEVSIADVADLIRGDPAISAKLLQWANSAFSGGQGCHDLHTAIVRIGLSAVSQMALLAGVFEALDPPDSIPGFDAELLRHHVGLISELSAELVDPEAVTTARLGGLFSEVGLLFEATYLPQRLAEAHDLAVATDVTLLEAEARLFGVTYPELGGHLLSVWGLPTDVVVATAGSHDRPLPCGTAPLRPAEAVRAARLVAQRFPHAKRIGPAHLDRLDDEIDVAVGRWQSAIVSRREPRS
ncbi:MAG: HDOD domain-containing protein [Acidimicrobiales bacterium]